MQRPVPLEKHILGFNSKLKGFRFDMSLNYKLPDILRMYSDQKATLIFCNSRKSTEMAAAALDKCTYLFQLSAQQKENLAKLSQRVHDDKLRKLIERGIAFHHAGITYEDRGLIEDNFRQGLLLILLCTNTLAMGVNLPAHLVIIKSTESYGHGTLEEYTESTVLQMIGRAGRPQFDKKGVAVILTQNKNVHKYESLINGKVPVESHLHKHLAEHLNSEIALNTINNLEVAMNWIRSTYLYVRAVRQPLKYGLPDNTDKNIIEKKLEEMCLEQINRLHSNGLITINAANGLDVRTTACGKLMAKYYICFETITLFKQVEGNEKLLEVLNLIVRCKEFSEFPIRVSEKKYLNELNTSPIRFPIRGRIKTREDKISCLIQAVFGNCQISSPGLAQESLKMIRISDRVAKCLMEYMRLQLNDFHLGCYKALLHSVTIAKCFHAKLWENSEYASKQLRKLGAVYSSLLANAGKTTLKSIAETDARTIELILNKSHPFGDEVLQNLLNFPEYSLQINLKAANMVYIYVQQINEAHVYNGSNAVIIVGDSANNLLLFNENLDSILHEYGFFDRTMKIPDLKVENIKVHVIHTTLVGVDVVASIVLNKPEPKENSSKIVCKRKRQSKLVKTISNKKLKSTAKSAEREDNTLNNTTLKLQAFCYTKLKLQSTLKVSSVSNSKQITDGTLVPAISAYNPTVPQRFEGKDLKTDSSLNNKSLLVQKKVTEYFTFRKNNINSPMLSSEITSYGKNKSGQRNDEDGGSEDKNSKNLQIALSEHCNINLPTELNNVAISNENLKPLDLSKSTAIENPPHSISVDNHDKPISTTVNRSIDIFNVSDLSYYQPKRVQNMMISKPTANCRKTQTDNNVFLNPQVKDATTKDTNSLIKNHTDPPKRNVFASEEDSLNLWYNVTLQYLQLKENDRNFVNFKNIFYTINEKKNLKFRQTNVQSTNPAITYKNHQWDSSHLCVKNHCSSMNETTSIPRNGITNPFRLQLFKENHSNERNSSATVNSINRRVMNYVLNAKCDETKNNIDDGFLIDQHEELILNQTQSDQNMTFDEYCRLYLDTHMKDP